MIRRLQRRLRTFKSAMKFRRIFAGVISFYEDLVTASVNLLWTIFICCLINWNWSHYSAYFIFYSYLMIPHFQMSEKGNKSTSCALGSCASPLVNTYWWLTNGCSVIREIIKAHLLLAPLMQFCVNIWPLGINYLEFKVEKIWCEKCISFIRQHDILFRLNEIEILCKSELSTS